MDYVIEILERERSILERCLNNWESEQYSEAKKERDKRLKEVLSAIELLKSPNNIPKNTLKYDMGIVLNKVEKLNTRLNQEKIKKQWDKDESFFGSFFDTESD